MNRVCCLALCLASLTSAVAEEPKTPRTDLYGDPLPPGAVMRFGTIRLRHAHAKVVFSKDGKQLISCDLQGEVRHWDVNTGKLVRRLALDAPAESRQFEGMELSPDGTSAATWDREAVYLWDLNTGKRRGRILLHSDCVGLLRFSSDGKFAVVQTFGEEKTTMQIFDVLTVKIRRTPTPLLESGLSSVAFTRDGKQLVGCAPMKSDTENENTLRLSLFVWDANSGKLNLKRKGLPYTPAAPFVFSPDGKLAATQDDRFPHEVRLLEVATLREVERWKPLKTIKDSAFSAINALAFSPDGKRLAAIYQSVPNDGQADENYLILWELGAAKQRRIVPLPHDISQLVFAPDGQTLAGRSKLHGEIFLWDATTGQSFQRRPGHDWPVSVLAASPDGKIVASGGDSSMLRLWDTAGGKQLRLLNPPHERSELIDSCLFSPDGKWLISIGNTRAFTLPRERIQLWDVAAGKLVRRFDIDGERFSTYAAVITADNKFLKAVVLRESHSVVKAQLIAWELNTAKIVHKRDYRFRAQTDNKSQNGPDAPATFTADAERVTIWLGDRLGIEEVSSGSLLAKLPSGVSRPLFFSPDGRLLAASVWKPHPKSQFNDFEGISLIETASGQEIFRLEKSFRDSAFTDDGRSLVACNAHKLCLWDTDTGVKRHERERPKELALLGLERNDESSCPPLLLPRGRMVADMADGDLLVWDLSAWTRRESKTVGELRLKELETLWSDLVGDAGRAYRAMSRLTDSPAATVAFFRDRLRPASKDKGIAQQLADLDSESFAVREAASIELTRLHYRAAPMLRQTLQNKPSLEMRRRIEAILTEPRLPQAEDLRNLRAIAVLERIGTPEARGILEKLGGGAVAPETREAQAALQSLKRRDASANERISP